VLKGLAVFVHCSQCQIEFPPGYDSCPACGSNNVMVGMVTPSGMRVAAHRDSAKRMKLQARNSDDGKTQYEFSVGGIRPTGGHGVRPSVAPHIKMYSDVVWSHDRQQMERRLIHVDSDNDYYKQEWFSLETGERTYFKEGRLSDPEMHGKSAAEAKQAAANRASIKARCT
jgi:hypothetical protein